MGTDASLRLEGGIPQIGESEGYGMQFLFRCGIEDHTENVACNSPHCHGNVFTELLPSNRREIKFTKPLHINTHADTRVYEIGLGAAGYLLGFVKTGSGIWKLMLWGGSELH
jgi:hypothetical protein